MRSKPDKNKTTIFVVANPNSIKYLKQELTKGGIDEDKIVFDTISNNVRQTCDSVIKYVQNRVNPPKIYFIGSAWLRESFDSIVLSKLKEYNVQFEGALDSRSVAETDNEKASG